MNSPRHWFPATSRRHRRGLSFVEFVGCILALGSGVAIGSVYLGVDMKTLFIGILERAELVDPGFFGNKAVAAQQTAPSADVPAIAVAKGGALPSTKPEPINSTAPPAKSETASTSAIVAEESAIPAESTDEATTDVAAASTEVELTDVERLAATLAYWEGLTASIAAEKAHRTPTSLDIENWQLFDFLTLRREGHELAVQAIEKLNERGVDERLLWHGRQVLSWHQAGAKLYGRAVDLLTDSPNDQLSGPFAQSWQSSATQHRMEEKLVREKHYSVAGYLDHTYKDEAPFKPAF